MFASISEWVPYVLCSAAEIARKGRQDFYMGHDGGFMLPIHSKTGQGMKTHFEELVNWHGRNELIPVYLEQKTLSISAVRSQIQRKF